jgi:hypothetical protein
MVFVTVFWPLTTAGEGETGNQEFDERRAAVLSTVKPTALVGQVMTT